MLLGVPIVLVLLPVTWILLTRLMFDLSGYRVRPVDHQQETAPLTMPRRAVTAVLCMTVLAWLLRPIIGEQIGLANLSDAGIALAGALLLFLIPTNLRKNKTLLTWNDANSLRWDVLILFGGGLALADAITSTGLARWTGSGAQQIDGFPVFVLVLVMMIVIVYLGELASNTAMAAVFLPIAAAVAVGLELPPMLLLLPVALAASLGFMLPVATPPNAIIYGSGAVTSQQMLKAGALLDVVSIAIVYAMAWLLGPIIFATS